MMKKALIMMAVAAVITVLTACNPTKELEANSLEINYTTLRNYFVNNYVDVSKEQHLYINSEEEFFNYFGHAAYMGNGGQPTQVNFKQQFVVAIVLPETNRETALNITDVRRNGDTIIIFYRENRGEKTSYTMVPWAAVALGKPTDARDFRFLYRKQ